MLRELSSFPLAVGELAGLAALSALGTADPNAGFPLGTLRGLLGLGGSVYTSPLFLGLAGLLGASLAACSYTRQWPQVKVARRWAFRGPEGVRGLPLCAAAARPSLEALAEALEAGGFQTFVEPSAAPAAGAAGGGGAGGSGRRLYAFKGLSGRLAPILVHVSLLLILAGALGTGLGGWEGSAMVPEGQTAPLACDARGAATGDGCGLRPKTPLGWLFTPEAVREGLQLQVDRFAIDYYPDGKVQQFRSDLSVLPGGEEGGEGGGDALQRKQISVNDPLREGGVTVYQTDWEVSGLRVAVTGLEGPDGGAGPGAADDAAAGPAAGPGGEAAGGATEGPAGATASPPGGGGGDGGPLASDEPVRLALPMAPLEGRLEGVQGRLWGAFLPLKQEESGRVRGVSIVARDLQTVTVYDSSGAFVGVRRPGSQLQPLEVDGLGLSVEAISGATGVELKADPGVPLVYAGCGVLMVTTLLSFQPFAQVWACEEPGRVVAGGRANRGQREFERAFRQALGRE